MADEVAVAGAPDDGGGDSGVEPEVTDVETPEEGAADTGQSEVADGPDEKDAPEPEGEVEEAEGEEGDEEESAGVELDADSVLKIGDTEHTLQEIHQALQMVNEAHTRIEAANQAVERSNSVLNAIKDKPADALMGIFTSVFGGDREKGYEATVKLAAQIINKHHELQQMHPAERKAMTLQAEIADRDRKLRAYQEEEQAKEQLAIENKWTTAITEGLKGGGLPASYLPRVAQKLHDAIQAQRQLTVSQAVESVKVDLKAERENLVKTLEPDEIPKDIAEKLARRRIDAARRRRGIAAAKAGGDGPTEQPKDDAIIYDTTKFLETFARTK